MSKEFNIKEALERAKTYAEAVRPEFSRSMKAELPPVEGAFAGAEAVTIHWTENTYISDKPGENEAGDIEQTLTLNQFNDLLSKASESAPPKGSGYNKICLSFKGCNQGKFYIQQHKRTLEDLI